MVNADVELMATKLLLHEQNGKNLCIVVEAKQLWVDLETISQSCDFFEGMLEVEMQICIRGQRNTDPYVPAPEGVK